MENKKFDIKSDVKFLKILFLKYFSYLFIVLFLLNGFFLNYIFYLKTVNKLFFLIMFELLLSILISVLCSKRKYNNITYKVTNKRVIINDENIMFSEIVDLDFEKKSKDLYDIIIMKNTKNLSNIKNLNSSIKKMKYVKNGNRIYNFINQNYR